MFTSGGGDGLYSSYWGFDADGRLVELVTDFDILYTSTDEHVELPLPLARGPVQHPFLQKHGLKLTFKKPLFSHPMLLLGSQGFPRFSLSDGTPVTKKNMQGMYDYYTWGKTSPGTRLVITLTTSVNTLKPL